MKSENRIDFEQRDFMNDIVTTLKKNVCNIIGKEKIWIEYDESKHYYGGKLRNKEILRENEIKSHLKCKLIRIKECNSYEKFEQDLLSNL